MSILSYDGKAIIPAPFFSSQKTSVEAAGQKLDGFLTITLKGKLVAYKGSPNSSGVFWDQPDYPPDETLADNQRLHSILAKQKALQALFSVDGKVLLVQPPDGSAPTQYNVTVKDVLFEAGNWVEECEYSITLEAPSPDEAGDNISEASEQWDLEPDEKLVAYSIKRVVSAKGRAKYDVTGALLKAGWECARDYVLSKRGLGMKPDRMSGPGVLDATELEAFDYVRHQSLNEMDGSFTVSEAWVGFDRAGGAPAIDEFTVNTRQDETGKVTVGMEGQIRGLLQRNDDFSVSKSRYENASAKLDAVSPTFKTRAETISGFTLNPIAVSTQTGRNELAGTISYSAEYDNRPLPIVAGSLSESVTVTDANPADVFASIAVLGRAQGPVLQPIDTVTSRKREASIEVVMPVKTLSFSPEPPATDLLVLSIRPPGLQVFLDQDTSSFNVRTGRYTRQVSWTWQ